MWLNLNSALPDGLGNVDLAGRERARDVRAHRAGLGVDRDADVGHVDLVGAGVHSLAAHANTATHESREGKAKPLSDNGQE